MITPTDQLALARLSSLQTILCCPRTKTDLRLVPIEELLSYLSEDERQRMPDGTIGAFNSDAAESVPSDGESRLFPGGDIATNL
jgi:hypothetical protein